MTTQPAVPTDFEKQLAEWEKRAQTVGGLLPQQQQQITELEQRLTELAPKEARTMQRMAGVFFPAGVPVPWIPTPKEREVSAEFSEIQEELEVLRTEFDRNLFQSDVYSIVPALVASGAVNSVDEALALVAIPDIISENELAAVRKSISELITARDIGAAPPLEIPELVPEGEAEEYPALVAPPEKRLLAPVSIHSLTTKELLKAFAVPDIPETTMTEEEWDNYLALKGWSQEDIDNQVQIQTEQLVAEAQNRKNLIESYMKEAPFMPEQTMIDIFQQAVINPPLVVLEGLNIYYEHVSMPAAGFLYGQIPDIEKAYWTFKGQNPEATNREAFVYAWKQWDAPGPPVLDFILKYMIMEGIVDPTTYIGWGFISKGLRSAGVPGRALARGNMAIGEVLELPFDLIKDLTGRILPKTISLRAAVLSRESTAILDRYFVQATHNTPFSFIKPRDMYKAGAAAIGLWKKNPRADNDIVLAANQMLIHPPVSRKEATSWIQRLRRLGVSTVEPEELLDSTLLDIDSIFERVFYQEINADEAAPLLMQKLGVLYLSDVTDDASILAARLLTDRANAIQSRALGFATERTANRAMREYAKKSLKVYTAQATSEAALAARKSGRLSVLLFDVDKRLIQPWLSVVDRMVIRTAAEAYLTFGLYGPMNVLEDYWRSILGGVKPGRVSVESFDITTMGLLVDPELRRGGLSEMIGPLREVGEAQRSNWILTMSLTPLSVPTWAATRGRVTPKQFAKNTYTTLVELFGGVGIDVRRNFVTGRYSQLLAEAGGDPVRALLEAIPKDLPGELASAPKWVKRNLAKDVRAAASTGKLTLDNIDLVNTLKARYTKDRILRAEVNDIIMKYPDVSPTSRSLIMDGFAEKTLLESPESVDDFMRNTVLNAEIDDFLKGPERATVQYEQLTNLLTSLEVTNPADMADLVVALHRMTATYGALPDQIMARATIKSRGLPINDRQLQFDAEFDRLYTFMDKAGADIDKVIEFVRTQPHMKGAYGDAAQRYLDIATTARKTISEAKAQDMAFRSSYFAEATQKDLRASAFWDEFYATENAHWRDTSVKMAQLNSRLVNATNDINVAAGIKIPTRPAVVVRGRPLAPADVAQLIGTRGDDISRMLLDQLIPEGDKDYFVEYALGMVREGYDEGFDRAAVGAVYDQICDSILVDPNSSSWFRSRQKQLEAMTKDFHDLYNAKLFPDEQKRAVDGFIDDAVRAVDDTMFERAPEPPVAAAESVLKDELASWRKFKKARIAEGAKQEELVSINLRIEGLQRELSKEMAARPPFAKAPTTGEGIATAIGVKYDGIQKNIPKKAQAEFGKEAFIFTDPQSGSTFMAKDLAQAQSELAGVRKAFGLPVEPPRRAVKAEFADYDNVRQSAWDEAQKWYYKEYPDYTNANAFDAMMKHLYPFWTYESQRWFWLPRSFVRRPGTLAAWGRWENNTDYGYVHIPGTAIDVNPARGNVYGPWSTRLMRRDYPEYYDELEGMGGFVGFFDFISRYGFYPNVIYGATLAQFGGAQPQTGGILPAIASTPLNAMIAAFPDNPLVNFISERIFPEQFRRYLTSRRVDDFGGDGSLIFAKMRGGVELTEEEQALWTQARQSVASHSALFEQFGMFRMRSDESYAVAEAATAFIEEHWGYTKEQQRQLRLRGEKLWDLIGGLDPWETAVLQELEFFKYSGSINPVLPSQQQEILNRIERDWSDVMAYSDALNLEVLDLQEDFLIGSERGRLSPDAFLSRVRELYKKRRDYIDEKTKANPLMLLENRTEYYEKYGQTMPVQSPYNELMDLFFSIELEETVDEFGARVYDWDKFWANRGMITDAIPEADKGKWEAFLSRNTAPMMQVWGDVYETYLRKYYGLWENTLKSYSDGEQLLIEEFLFLERTQQQLDRQAAIKDMVSEKTGLKLISSFRSDVSEDRIALRYANPHLDAWLFYWGRTTSFQTSQAEAVYKQLAKRTGRKIE